MTNDNSALTLGPSSTDHDRLLALEQRQLAIIKRIEQLELRITLSSHPSNPAPQLPPSATAPTSALPIASPIQARLQKELIQKGLVNHRFVRAPPEYYDRPLEFRQGIVGAASTHHLCKTIIMENTRVGADEPGVTKYFMVIVQYTARLHSEKLRNFVHAVHNGTLGKSKINMRLCPEEVSDALSGFEHNGVSPIGIKTKLPIIMSNRIMQLPPNEFFWLGAGEVDLKVGLPAADFVKAYAEDPVHVVDCTYAD